MNINKILAKLVLRLKLTEKEIAYFTLFASQEDYNFYSSFIKV